MSSGKAAKSSAKSKIRSNWLKPGDEQLPTLSEEDREELRKDLFDFAKDKLGVSDSRANYLADTYSVISTS